MLRTITSLCQNEAGNFRPSAGFSQSYEAYPTFNSIFTDSLVHELGIRGMRGTRGPAGRRSCPPPGILGIGAASSGVAVGLQRRGIMGSGDEWDSGRWVWDYRYGDWIWVNDLRNDEWRW